MLASDINGISTCVSAFNLCVAPFSELGVLSWRLDADNYETDPELKKIRETRGYSYMVW